MVWSPYKVFGWRALITEIYWGSFMPKDNGKTLDFMNFKKIYIMLKCGYYQIQISLWMANSSISAYCKVVSDSLSLFLSLNCKYHFKMYCRNITLWQQSVIYSSLDIKGNTGKKWNCKLCEVKARQCTLAK